MTRTPRLLAPLLAGLLSACAAPVAEGPVAEGPASEGPASEGPVSEGPVMEGPTTTGPRTPGELPAEDGRRVAIEAALDGFHLAASEADGAAYFGSMTADAVFLGTDATERWNLDQFRAYAGPYFDRGQGWTYQPLERHVSLSGNVAWFDERLWNEKYGESRGTGVLVLEDGRWRVAHYNLTFPMPNDLAGEFTRRIREHSGR